MSSAAAWASAEALQYGEMAGQVHILVWWHLYDGVVARGRVYGWAPAQIQV